MLMKKIILFSLAICAAIVTWAVPADRTPFVLTLVDGTQVVVTMCGDENFSWYETADGNIVEETKDGYVLGKRSANDVRTLAHKARKAAPRRIGSQATAPLPSLGSPHIPVILVNFQDSVFHTKPTEQELLAFYDLYFNGTRDGVLYKDHGSYGAVRDYFSDQSHGQFTPEFDIIGIVTLDHNEEHYGQNSGSSKDTRYSDFCKEAATKAMEKYDVDWEPFSNRGGQNVVDMTVFVYAGCGENTSGVPSTTLWPKWSSLGFTVNGIKFKSGLCSSENMPIKESGVIIGAKTDGIGVFCHEMNHALGLPDFYDTGLNGFGMDLWSIMDYGQYGENGYIPAAMTSYEREFMGWLKIEEITSSGWLTLAPIADGGKGYKIVNPYNSNEYYVLENRQRVGWDEGVCRFGHGLLITHVDYDAGSWSSNSVNNNVNHQRMTIIAANNRYIGTCVPNVTRGDLLETWSGNCYPFEKNDSLTSNSTPAATVFTPADGFMNMDLNGIRENDDLTVSFYAGNDFADGLSEVVRDARPQVTAPIVYDLMGRRVWQPRKGLFIVGDRKILVK